MLAGIPVTDDDTQTLVELLREAEFPDVADKLERGLALGTKIFALTVVDRESMLRALAERPDGLGELRAVSPTRARVAGACGTRGVGS